MNLPDEPTQLALGHFKDLHPILDDPEASFQTFVDDAGSVHWLTLLLPNRWISLDWLRLPSLLFDANYASLSYLLYLASSINSHLHLLLNAQAVLCPCTISFQTVK
ncbi:hypothetical protein PCASD_20913 [Puccinia coronata f. sp. avenae]|uniref:Uncharacterized protein n=1 Tax=Puccinia coronata f. sp. avenae TaxID=200324 RepID=A0A2N5TVU0_9BASI|nr:hypothetical protein PCASD_20913 [Puccinia coronata f. sp. avenae]